MTKNSRKVTKRHRRKARFSRSIIAKLHSSRNAVKHGLCIRLGDDRDLHDTAHQIARAIAGANAEDALFEQALIFAESELELRRIRQFRLATIETAIATGSTQDIACRTSDVAAQREAEAVLHALPTLKAIERYERRSYSRRKKASQLLHALRALCSNGVEPLQLKRVPVIVVN